MIWRTICEQPALVCHGSKLHSSVWSYIYSKGFIMPTFIEPLAYVQTWNSSYLFVQFKFSIWPHVCIHTYIHTYICVLQCSPLVWGLLRLAQITIDNTSSVLLYDPFHAYAQILSITSHSMITVCSGELAVQWNLFSDYNTCTQLHDHMTYFLFNILCHFHWELSNVQFAGPLPIWSMYLPLLPV